MKNKHGFAHIEIIVVILLIAIVGVVVLVVGKNSNTPLVSLSSPTPAATVEDGMSGWETYTNEYWGFNVKYPADLLKICTDYTTDEEGVRFWKSNFDCPVATDFFYEIGIVGHKPGDYKDYKEPTSSTEIMIAGQSANKKVFIYTEEDGPLFGLGNSTDVILETDKGTLEFQLLNKDEQLFDQILSTFEFVGSSDETWEAFTSEKIVDLSYSGYDIRFPTSWTKTNTVEDIYSRFTLQKGSYSIEIDQSPRGGGMCIFDDSPDFEGPSKDLKDVDYIEIEASFARLRRYMTADPKIYLFCQKGSGQGEYFDATNIGQIKYTVPISKDETILEEMDSIIKTIKVNE